MKRWLALCAVVVLPRLLVFPFNENLYGDAVARTWLAEYWAESPHLIGSFAQGARQFGPLHLYLLALAEWLWPSPEHAGRALSLLAGCLGAWPLHALARRISGPPGGALAVVGYGLWGMHLQCSTTAASEALGLTLVLACLAALASSFDEGPRAMRWFAALLLNLACATRYDAWLLVPLLGALTWWQTRRWGPAVDFVALSSAFAVPWLFGHFVDFGDPLYPLHYIDDFHREWFRSEAAGWGPVTYRALVAVFWPGTALVTLGPPLALAGLVGMGVAWRRAPARRWLVLVVVLPAALYTFRAAVLGSFVPLARFAVKEVALLLPFAWLGVQSLGARLQARARVAAWSLSVLVTVAWPAWLGWFTYAREGAWEDTLRPVSPTSTNEASVRAIGRALHPWAGEGQLLVDVDPRGYDDLQAGFLSGFPFSRLARVRSPLFEARLMQGPWRCVLFFDGGPLARQVASVGPVPTFRGVPFPAPVATAGRMHAACRSLQP